MDTNTPLITIGMTCYNAADTIARAYESATAQSWENTEIIIVDDCSSDQSPSIISALIKDNPKARLIKHEKNKGFPAALNTIAENAKGDFIAFFDDDDDSVPERLTKQYVRLTEFEKAQNSDLVLCYTDRDVYIDGAQHIDAYVHAIGREDNAPHGSMVADFLLWHYQDPDHCWGQFGSCTLMVRRNVFDRVGLFDTNFRRSAEWDMAIRLADLGAYFIAVAEPLVKQHKTFTQDKSGKKPLNFALMLRDKHKPYLHKRGVYIASKAMAYSRYYYTTGQKWHSRAALAFACISAPHLVLPCELKKRNTK